MPLDAATTTQLPSRVRILIHAAGMARGGGLRHLAGFLPALRDTLPHGAQVCLIVRESSLSALGELGPQITTRPVSDMLASAPWARLALDSAWVPHVAEAHAADVVVSLANFGPVRIRRPHVVFQTNALFFSSDVLQRASPVRKLSLLSRRALASAAMRRSALVVTPSLAMAELVAGVLPSVRSRLRCLPHATVARDAGQAKVRPSSRLVFLCPGVGASHKGLDILVPALGQVGDRDFQVRALGHDTDWPAGFAEARALATRLQLGARLVIEPELAFDEMPAAYASVDALVYPTRCESFGFSLLEALTAGLPVIASDISVNREIAGDAALYYDVGSSAALAAAMRRMIDEPPLRESLSRAARARAASRAWTWSSYAHEFLSICAEARAGS